jgi:hypothetical protein
MDVGVTGTIDVASGREIELIALEVVTDRLYQGDEPEKQGEVCFDLWTYSLTGSLEPDTAVEIMRDSSHNGDND